MKERRRLAAFLSAALLGLAMLSGCGSSGSAKESGARRETADYMMEEPAAAAAEYYSGGSDYDYDYEESAAEEAGFSKAAKSEGVLTDDPGSNAEVEAASESRKLIKTVNMSVETENFDELVNDILNKITALGGYPQNSSINGNNYGSSSKRYAYITARIPAKNLDSFVNGVAEKSNVLSRDESIDDVTLNYVDMEAKKKSLETEYDRLNKLIETAEDLETLILLEERLAEVRYELESYESRLRTMDNQVQYSTVNINIEEVVTYTPTPTHEKTLLERMGGSFKESCISMVEGLENLLVLLVAALPFLMILAVFALIVFLIVKLCIKKSRQNAKKRAEKKAANKPKGYDPMTGKPIMEEENASDKKDESAKKASLEEKPDEEKKES